MKPQHLLAVLALGLAAFAVDTPPSGPRPAENTPPEVENILPLQDGQHPGRFLLSVSAGQTGTSVALRIDSATGRTWKLDRWQTRQIDAYHWEECLEPETFRKIHQADTPK